MDYDELRERVLSEPIGIHSARLWRVAENIREHSRREASDDRLLHLMSRVGGLSSYLAEDLRSGRITVDQAAIILDQLADLGKMSFDQWRS
jgi:hypothetical protein